MTNQQAFEISVKHMLCAKGQSINSEGDCAYRGKHGRKCAIGVLIPDEQYHEEMEGESVKFLHLACLENLNLGLLIQLQGSHDTHNKKEGKLSWPPSISRFKSMAERHGLDASFLNRVN